MTEPDGRAVTVVTGLPRSGTSQMMPMLAAGGELRWEWFDSGADRLPGYAELYQRWERQHWGAYAVDLTADRRRWREATARQRQYFLIVAGAILLGFRHTESRVTDALGPYLRALPREEQRLYLATQIADEARHTVFFDRYFREVLGSSPDDFAATLPQARPWQQSHIVRLVSEVLPAAVERLRAHPDDEAALVEAVTLYHLIIEAAVGFTYQRALLRFVRRVGGLPGLCAGLTGLLRDEARHVVFGTRVLRELVRKDAAHGATLVRCVAGTLPLLRRVLGSGTEAGDDFISPGIDPDRRYRAALTALDRHLRAVGLRVQFPAADEPGRRACPLQPH